MEKKITGVHHIALRPSPDNFDKTVKFYGELLGMEEVCSWGEGTGRVSMLSTGDNSVMEILSTEGAVNPLPTGAIDHMAFATEMVDELVETVRNAGYEITVEPKDVSLPSNPPMPIRIAFCKGPIGELVEFFHVK